MEGKNMIATFNIKVNIVDRNFTLLTDTEEMKNVPTALAINLLKIFESNRPRVRREIENFFTTPTDESQQGGEESQTPGQEESREQE